MGKLLTAAFVIWRTRRYAHALERGLADGIARAVGTVR